MKRYSFFILVIIFACNPKQETEFKSTDIREDIKQKLFSRFKASEKRNGKRYAFGNLLSNTDIVKANGKMEGIVFMWNFDILKEMYQDKLKTVIKVSPYFNSVEKPIISQGDTIGFSSPTYNGLNTFTINKFVGDTGIFSFDVKDVDFGGKDTIKRTLLCEINIILPNNKDTTFLILSDYYIVK